jgi:hypothetical protein
LILVIVMSRYVVQVGRIIIEIRRARRNRELHAEIKKMDLNAIDLTHNNSLNFQDMHKVDQLVHEKMQKRRGALEEDSRDG